MTQVSRLLWDLRKIRGIKLIWNNEDFLTWQWLMDMVLTHLKSWFIRFFLFRYRCPNYIIHLVCKIQKLWSTSVNLHPLLCSSFDGYNTLKQFHIVFQVNLIDSIKLIYNTYINIEFFSMILLLHLSKFRYNFLGLFIKVRS